MSFKLSMKVGGEGGILEGGSSLVWGPLPPKNLEGLYILIVLSVSHLRGY